MNTRSSRPLVVCLVCSLAFALVAGQFGCGGGSSKPAPETVAATGEVIMQSQPMKGGFIEFASIDNPTLTVNATIGDDGKFSLQTMIDSKRIDGAPPGTYKVIVTPMLTQDQTTGEMPEPIELPKPYVINKEGENHFKINFLR